MDIYINGVKADGLDLSTFWPKNALRVEYIESPDDPRYAGSSRVVNFVMKEYVTGGLTKISADQTFPNNGNYSIASKLVYGKMTYNAIFSGGYSRDHLSGEERTENYDDVWYGGDFYDLITREQRTDRVTRSDNLYGGFNARYRSKTFTMTHSAGLQWTRNPDSHSSGSVSYSPDIIAANSMQSLSRARSLSPMLSGSYVIVPGGKWSYMADWSISHSHNNNYSRYTESVTDPILTTIRENMLNYSASFWVMYAINNRMAVDMKLTESRAVSSADYGGTVISRQWQQTGHT